LLVTSNDVLIAKIMKMEKQGNLVFSLYKDTDMDASKYSAYTGFRISSIDLIVAFISGTW